MQLIRGLINLKTQPSSCVATIGNFDGVHIGHQAIIKQLVFQAKALNLPAYVLLFEPHPKEFFLGDECPARLTCLREKYEQLKHLGVDCLVVLPFNSTLRQMQPKDFVQTILIDQLRIKHLVVGDDFRFGRDRQGDFQLLDNMAKGHYTLEPTASVTINQERVSSTLIRESLKNHQLDKAAQLLGRRFSMSGKVGYGQQLGRQIGFATANIAVKRKKLPLSGVYWVKCHWREGNQQLSAWGAANCGIKPTVDGETSCLEVHLLGVSPELYGIELCAEFYQWVRAEQRFSDIGQLKHQIQQDINKIKQLILQYK